MSEEIKTATNTQDNVEPTQSVAEEKPAVAIPAEQWWSAEDGDKSDYVDVTPAAPDVPVYAQPVQPVQPQPVYAQPVQPVQPQPVYAQPVRPVQPQPVYAQPVQPVQPQPVYAQPVYAQPVQPVQPQPVYAQPVQPQPVYQYPAQPQNSGNAFSVLALIFGIVALLLGSMPYIGWSIDAVAVTFGILGRQRGDRTARSILGIVFGAIGTVVAILYLVQDSGLLSSFGL